MGLAGNIGLDEGALLEAVSRPLVTETTTTYKYRGDKVIEEKTRTMAVSLADLIGIIVVAVGVGGVAAIMKDIREVGYIKPSTVPTFPLLALLTGAPRKPE